MAGHHHHHHHHRRLMLSGLKTNTGYYLSNNVSPRRCLINVKLTDFCMRSVESLMDSDKGAFFSLWFDENGGKMSIPVNQDKRIFQFKTAPLHDGEGHSSLECVHQGVNSLNPRSQDQLSCWGVTEHRLTVQGTDEVYVRTKQQVKEAEKLRKEQRTQEIQPQSRTKSAKILDRVSPVPPFRKINRPKSVTPSFTKSIVANKPSGLSTAKPHPSLAKSVVISDTKSVPKPSSRSTYSLKDRVIHILALKPHSREHIVARLKKATKRSENAMTNLDSILDEVSETSLDGYKLKSQYLKNLEVDQWPFYHNAEKQMLKRSKNLGEQVESIYEPSSEGGGQPSSSSSSKRPNIQQQTQPPKKQKLVHPPFSSESPLTRTQVPPPATSTSTSGGGTVDTTQVESSSERFTQPKHVEARSRNSAQHLALGDEHLEEEREGENNTISRKQGGSEPEISRKHTSTTSKNKPKKKKKRKREDEIEESEDVMASDPTSTSFTPDHISQFPPLSCDEERRRYKQIFNKEYDDYLQLKDSIDQVATQYQRDCSALSERLNSVVEHSDEYMEVKKLIRDKYRDSRRNKSYFENKNKFNELHQKLDHIKKMVLEYDSRQRES